MPIKVLLQPFIRIVYAKLLKTIPLQKKNILIMYTIQRTERWRIAKREHKTYVKWFKPIYVKDANGSASTPLAHGKRFINLFNQPVKQASINWFCQGIPGIRGLEDGKYYWTKEGGGYYKVKENGYMHSAVSVSIQVDFN